ncbi:MAG TPA: phenylalanine--tRNA ligase subunit beta [Terriglobales bacterium]|nr:phenylalanine--tRNA ligase subunit beta [Terriglobales bacterium]
MRLSAQWIREFVDVPVDNGRLAEDLTSIGIAVEGISGEGANTVFEMEIGTNRPDAMNHYGVAREAAAFYGIALKPIETSEAKAPRESESGNAALKRSSTQNPAAEAGSHSGSRSGTAGAAPSRSTSSAGGGFAIVIDDKDGCARYTAQIVRGVKIANSPEHIALRLALVDQRAINNAADASNYTLWEMGHPTHAFDLDLLQGGKIVVRRARDGETLKTLDGVDRKLSSEDLIIADTNRPVALAGVMGGFDTMITDKTRNILIESAWFDPVAVRKTAKCHGLHTDASHRFERGADYGATSLACSLVAQRIMESGGGELEGSQIDAVAREIDQAPVVLRISQVHRMLGSMLETHQILAILKRLGFELVPEPGAQPEFSVQIPSWRLDIEREIDLIEEVARLHGYNNFANTLPSFSGGVVENPETAKAAKARSTLLALGYNEAVSLSFISNEDAETFSSTPVVELANPLSEEASLMRGSLLPGMLEMVAFNLNRGTDYVRLFEMGDIYEGSGFGTAEHARICFAATASAMSVDIPQGGVLDKSKGEAGLDLFRSIKGDIETVLGAFENSALHYDDKTSDYYQPRLSARVLVNGAPLAQFGLLHPEVVTKRKLRQDVYVAEINAEELYKHSLRLIRYEPLPKYPGVERDFSFLFPDKVTFDQIEKAVQRLAITELRSFAPVEIFRGGSVPAGSYSILLRAKFQSHDRTLREDEVNDWTAKIVSELQKLGGTQRA